MSGKVPKISSDHTSKEAQSKNAEKYCREYWTGDSKDGQYINGDGYHYFHMKEDGYVIDAYEYYETDDGEEKSSRLPEFTAINWFEFFGFEDDELLEEISHQEFEYVKEISKSEEKKSIHIR